MTTERIGRYEVIKELGAGAMAVVYKAVDPIIGRTVAIKTIKIDASIGIQHEELRQRFYREAQNAGNLNHPSIVTIYDIGAAGNIDYIAMEFVEGESLQDWIAKNPIPPIEQTIAIIEQIASGLDYAASHGIIHRDIKPANILLTLDMKAKIADFGIAKISTSKFTQTGAVIGTPSYMSPEQAMGKTLDGRTDIFSLGVIFYEMLTGEKPFAGTNPSTIIYKILHEEPVKPQQLNVTLHPAFNEIVGKMLAKDPDKRYQNCSQLIHDLRNYTSLNVEKEEPEKPATPAKAKAKKSNRPLVFVIFSVLVAALAVFGYMYYQQTRKPAVKEAATIQTPPPEPPKADTKAKAEDMVLSEKVEQQKLPDATPPAADIQTAAKEEVPAAKKEPVPKEEIGRAEVRLEFAGEGYPIAVYDGTAVLKGLSASNPSIQITAGNHRFRIVSNDVYLDVRLDRVKLKADEVYTIPVPALCSAFIEVTNDAYDGCEIRLNDKRLSTPYPAQIPKLAAGNHRIVFRWDSGKYEGKELSSTFAGEANHHYRIRGEPARENVLVQQLR
ncbi:MAG: protein kinase [Acidobacteria bacterium]|nr:protein kinase [Acidobacteriota bacterium]